VGLTRFELVTPRLSSVCSNQLSYRPGYSRGCPAAPGISFKEPLPVLSKLDSACLRHLKPDADRAGGAVKQQSARSIFEMFESRALESARSEVTLERR
jgi:hypothetical protein